MDAINVTLMPLHLSPIYKEKLIILCDKPNPGREADYAAFKTKFPYLEQNQQIHLLEHCSIEECYPAAWKRTAVQVQNMKASDKKKLAKECGDAISLEAFEQEMPAIKAALDRAWEKAFV